MTITELQQQYAAHPNTAVMKRLLKDTSVQTVFCGGLYASAASLFSSVLVQEGGCPFVFILGDLEEAGYFYHDLTQILGSETVLFSHLLSGVPSSTDRKTQPMRFCVRRC